MLIVDDEAQIRTGISKMLCWSDYDIEICGEASDGREALRLMEECEPDFVLTDIKMPEMDGLELLREAKERELNCRIIVLSGYNDFAFVKQAMKCGAVDYLLKPVGRGELLQTIEEQLQQTGEKRLFRWKKDETLETARNSFFNRIMTNSISALEFREKQELFEVDFGTGLLAVARLESEQADAGGRSAWYAKTEILETCQMFLEERKKGYAFRNLSGGVVCILTDVQGTDIHLGCGEMLNGLLLGINRKFSERTYFSVSTPVRSYRSLHSAYQEAERVLRYKFVFDAATVLFAGEIEAYYQGKESAVLIRQEEIEGLIKEGDGKKTDSYLEEKLGKWEEELPCMDLYVCRNRAVEIIIFLFRFMTAEFAVDRVHLTAQKDEALNRLAVACDGESVKAILSDLLRRCTEYYQDNMNAEYSKIVSDTLRRVKAQYADMNLSLQYLAEEFGVNTAYLGRIFKKETGVSFANYLNSCRVEAAARLLRETNKKGSDIYKLVGFSNYNYFYIVFKKLTGKNPMEIRDMDKDPGNVIC